MEVVAATPAVVGSGAVERDQIQTRLQINVYSILSNQQFNAWLDRRVHRSPPDYLSYLKQSIPIDEQTYMVKGVAADQEIYDLEMI